MAESIVFSAADVALALEDRTFTANTEAALQLGVAEVLESRFPGAFAREYSGFGRRDRPDFYCVDRGIVVEVKINTSGGSAPKVFAQLARYAEHASVRELVLITPSRRIASLVGEKVGGKPLTRAVVSLGY